jgi:hypothetical protein
MVAKATRCQNSAAFFFALAIFISGSLTVGSRPAMAVDSYGCRGDQACVKTAETTHCDAACQKACREYRYDYVTCYSVWGPKFEFQRSQEAAKKRGTK